MDEEREAAAARAEAVPDVGGQVGAGDLRDELAADLADFGPGHAGFEPRAAAEPARRDFVHARRDLRYDADRDRFAAAAFDQIGFMLDLRDHRFEHLADHGAVGFAWRCGFVRFGVRAVGDERGSLGGGGGSIFGLGLGFGQPFERRPGADPGEAGGGHFDRGFDLAVAARQAGEARQPAFAGFARWARRFRRARLRSGPAAAPDKIEDRGEEERCRHQHQ
ncbi:MAG: hypothetical protein A2885_21490 [Sphingopyxis sp. RIFCSPHIGHO2_01_FULL_65_24]|nr:MAG: hypothetical protein A2885_21490 [Sphingopyxis sp. RIFCSPHIGHO2_01_FULL_65_24]